MRESAIEKYLTNQVSLIGGVCWKFTSTRRGVPDRLVLLPLGVVIFVELKAPGKKVSVQQEHVHKLMSLLGHTVFVCDSKESIDEVLHAL